MRNWISAAVDIICALAMGSRSAAREIDGGAKVRASGAIIPSQIPIAGSAMTASGRDSTAKPPATDNGKKTLSVRVVAYQIDAKLDPAKHTITATETLTYHNLTGQPQQEFPFHMYLNAFQPQSGFM